MNMKKNFLIQAVAATFLAAGSVHAADTYIMVGANFDFYAADGTLSAQTDVGGQSHTAVFADGVMVDPETASIVSQPIDFTAATGRMVTGETFNGNNWVADVNAIQSYDGATGGTQAKTYTWTEESWFINGSAVVCRIAGSIDNCVDENASGGQFLGTADKNYAYNLTEGQFALHLFFDWSVNSDIPVLAVYNITAIDANGNITAVQVDTNGDGIPGTPMATAPFPGQTPVFNAIFRPVTKGAGVSAQSALTTNEDTAISISKADFTVNSGAFPASLFLPANQSLSIGSGTGYSTNGTSTVTPSLNVNTALTVPVGIAVNSHTGLSFNASVSQSQTAGSVTSSGTTATVSLNGHGYSTGDELVIVGGTGAASDVEYNGTYTITVVDANTFTYTFGGSATSPAVNTIKAFKVATTSSSMAFSSTVGINAINDAPIITSSSPTSTVVQNAAYSFTVTSSDVDTGDTATYSLSGAPSWMGINSSTGVISGTPGATDVTATTGIVVTVTDSGSATDTQTFSVAVTNINDAPVISSVTPTATVAQGAAYSFTVTSTDADVGDTATYSLSGNPSWMSINSSTGAITGTPGATDVKSTTGIVVTVTDSAGATGSKTFNVTVSNVNDAPVITNTPAASAPSNSTYSFVPNVTDADGETSFTFTRTGTLPSWLSFNSTTGALTGSAPGVGEIGNVYTGSVTAADAANATDTVNYSITVTGTNTAPVITSSTPTGTVAQGSAYSFTITSTDVDSGDTATYSLSGNPSWMSINSSTGVITGTPGAADVTSATGIVATVTDAAGATDTQTFSVTVSNVNDAPIISSSTPIGTVAQGSPYSFTVTSTDADVGDTATYSLSGNPSWMSINSSTGAITGTPGATDVKSTTGIVVTVTDAAGATGTQTFSVSVTNINDAPVITSSTPPTTVAQDVAYSFTVTSSDADAGDAASYSLTGAPSWMSINTSTGVIGGTPSITDIASTTGITVTVTDTAGATDTQTFAVTVTSVNGAPVANANDCINESIEARSSYSCSIIAEDADAGDQANLVYSVAGLPASLSINSSTGAITGTTTDNDVTTSPYSVVITVTDPSAASDTVSYALTVVVFNEPPVAGNTLLSTPENTALVGSVVSLVSDPENCACLTFKHVSLGTDTVRNTSKGSVDLKADGSFTYTPNAGATGGDSFDYIVTDELRDSVPGTVQIVVGTVEGDNYPSSNFTMFNKKGENASGGANDVVATWDGISTTDIASTEFAHMTLSSITPFNGFSWAAHHIRVFGPGAYRFDTTCTVADLEAGITACNRGLVGEQTEQFIEMVVAEGQIGAHILFDWSVNPNIDVVNVWDVNAKFVPGDTATANGGSLFVGAGYGPYPWSGVPAADTVWRLASADPDGDGKAGVSMVDGAFIGFNANFNLDIVSSGSNFTMFNKNGENASGGANDVGATWDGISTTDIASTEFAHMTLSSITPFNGFSWAAHHIRVFGPGTYRFDTTCTVADLEAGITACNRGLVGEQTEQFIEMVVAEGQIGAHILFDWSVNPNIDVVNVWDVNAKFTPGDTATANGGSLFVGAGYGPYPWSGVPAADTVWRLASADPDGDGKAGVSMVDGAFIGFNANFNLFVGSGEVCKGTPLECGVIINYDVFQTPDGNSSGKENVDGAGSAFGLLALYMAWLGMSIRARRKQ